MSRNIYIVKRGDSLTKIAHTHGSQASTLAELNGITNPDIIRVGQKLRLPVKNSVKLNDDNSKSSSSGVDASSEKSNKDLSLNSQDQSKDMGENISNIFIQFYDVLSKPIEGLKVIVVAGGKLISHITGKDGHIPEVKISSASPQVKIQVEKITGGTKEIATFNATPGWQHVLLTSPKLCMNVDQRPHEGPPPPVKVKPSPATPRSSKNNIADKSVTTADVIAKAEASQAKQQLGKVTQTRSSAGHPVTQSTLECPNPENLRLDRNFKYRDIIIAAGKRSNFMPQAIAAIMNAEAATIIEITYQPILGKDKKPIIDSKTGKKNPGKLRKITESGIQSLLRRLPAHAA